MGNSSLKKTESGLVVNLCDNLLNLPGDDHKSCLSKFEQIGNHDFLGLVDIGNRFGT